MTDFRDPAPSDLQDWHEPKRRPAGEPEPLCRVCGIWTSHQQDADDTWICEDCEELET